MSEVALDPEILWNSTLPILLVMLATNILRNNLNALLRDTPKADMTAMRQNNLFQRARMLKAAGARFLLDHAFRNRKAYFCRKDGGRLANPPSDKNAAPPDPMQQMGPMKGQVVYMVIQGMLGYWVSFLFNGFLVGKTPFPLTFRFKGMLQRGVDVDSLEPGYISGLCWYFICIFTVGSLQGLLMSLFTDERGNADFTSQDEMMMMMGVPPAAGGMPGMMGQPDNKKLYTTEKEQLEIHYFESSLGNVEIDLWKKWKKNKISAAA